MEALHGGLWRIVVSRRTSLARAAVWLLWVSLVAVGQTPTIRVPVRLVSVPTLVASPDGKYVVGLSADDFRLIDENRVRPVHVDADPLPIAVVAVVQTSEDVREYLPFVARVGNLLANALAGANGRTALITYSDEVSVAKGFDGEDLSAAFKKISAGGEKAQLVDAGFRALDLLKKCPAGSSHVLLFIGQSAESGSNRKIAALAEQAERENVQIYALRLPTVGKSFVSDSFALGGMGQQNKGGLEASVELTKAVPALRRAGQVSKIRDPFSVLTIATGGLQLRFRKQKQLEDAIIAMGDALRSRYTLSFTPDEAESGFHALTVRVDVPGAKVYARAGYLAR